MAVSTNYKKLCLSFAVAAVFFFSLTLLPPKSGGIQASSSENEELRKMVLGSRPPACVNKCKNCKPCEATLVIPPHQSRIKRANSHREDDSYYLLSWKCRCGNKLYQP
ncbi:EPIDERMAL PATTERNING FACTOR-like protein 8 [Sesamum alatum]|uniref:Epidermal patterning factor-like protein n=1 Tax=Sesamum alatum TaxID=300844 RepID=A0AAE2CMU9_9LAMI|nr:EPIDERMAL PATTERNING FACTOR-like protein 8 [Sesamum alatum]